MKMKDILFPECILTHVKAENKEEALLKLFQVLSAASKVKPSFYEAVLEREKNYPTGLELEEWNAAIPHVTSDHVLSSAMGIAVLDTPITFQRMDDDVETVEVKVIFNIALDANGKQLDILQEIMGMVANADIMDRLAQAETPEQVISILKKVGA